MSKFPELASALILAHCGETLASHVLILDAKLTDDVKVESPGYLLSPLSASRQKTPQFLP